MNTGYRRIARAVVWAALVTLAGTTGHAAEVVLDVTDETGGRAAITFAADSASERAVVISTQLVGVAGSKLTITIDRSAAPLFVHSFSDDECRFENDQSRCETAIAGGTQVYDALVYAFKKGLNLHLQVETAGLMAMSQSQSLSGFTAAYDRP